MLKKNHSAQKIFQNPVANLKSCKIHENLESKKYVMGCISSNAHLQIFQSEFFAQTSYLENKLRKNSQII
jgi:hypothetical protein